MTIPRHEFFAGGTYYPTSLCASMHSRNGGIFCIFQGKVPCAAFALPTIATEAEPPPKSICETMENFTSGGHERK